MTCRKCGTEVAANALICYRCGTATAEPRVQPPTPGSVFDRPRRRWPIVPLLIAALLIAILLWFLFGTPLSAASELPAGENHEQANVVHGSEALRADGASFTVNGPGVWMARVSHGAWLSPGLQD